MLSVHLALNPGGQLRFVEALYIPHYLHAGLLHSSFLVLFECNKHSESCLSDELKKGLSIRPLDCPSVIACSHLYKQYIWNAPQERIYSAVTANTESREAALFKISSCV